ncbi:mannose-6-phosphate isomerase-like protein (cupin superfamily) [Methanocalculus alkaliphilus]|uniref:cupin domain-containing protein n=1 Tax=Methanocalculus alkaliphilus TaxID=768730 RepID=UPI00209D9A3D|nr:cupin domain-containing protein [Methanocalculus alkaliphilus]MCP1714655.1 mannose-6-phosphate isomerase-like protein (cupin superfamily) [Methanocalculus alkaliphilus]
MLLLIIPLLLFAGCLTAAPPEEEGGAEILVIEPMDPFPIFEGQALYSHLVTTDTPIPPMNYNLGHVTISPGNATDPHRLLGTSEIVFVLDGIAEIHCDETIITAGKGELILLPEGVLQSIVSVGETDLRYLSANQPPYRDAIDIRGDELASYEMMASQTPIVISDPEEGIEWDYETGTMIYTLINPVLMPELDLPIDYSVAYAEILPGGRIVSNKVTGAVDLIYVIEGSVDFSTPEGVTITVRTGDAAYFPPGQAKEIRNSGDTPAILLSIVDPAWRPAFFETG